MASSGSENTRTTPQPTGSRSRSSLACVPCRSRHSKCDAKKPSCTRCQTEGKTCSYAKSRRGLKKAQTPDATTQARGFLNTSIDDLNATQGLRRASGAAITTTSHETTPDYSVGHAASGSEQSHQHEAPAKSRQLVLYFENFHDSHPIVLPQWYFSTRLEWDAASVQLVLMVMEYIGSHYDPRESPDARRQAAHNILTNAAELPPTAFTVQALMLYAMALHFSDEYQAADDFLDKAMDVALRLEMNRQPFARAYGEGDPILEESWRRTYWTLYLMDVMFAVISHRTSHRLRNVISDVDLPGGDREYEFGVSRPARPPRSALLTDTADDSATSHPDCIRQP